MVSVGAEKAMVSRETMRVGKWSAQGAAAGMVTHGGCCKVECSWWLCKVECPGGVWKVEALGGCGKWKAHGGCGR